MRKEPATQAQSSRLVFLLMLSLFSCFVLFAGNCADDPPKQEQGLEQVALEQVADGGGTQDAEPRQELTSDSSTTPEPHKEDKPEPPVPEQPESTIESGPTTTGWLQSGGSIKRDFAGDVAVDDKGNVYVIGNIGGKAEFGSITLAFSGFSNPFIAKLDKEGAYVWVKRIGTPKNAMLHGLMLGKEGNVYVVGNFEERAEFGSITLKEQDGPFFVAKLNEKGDFVWAKSFKVNNKATLADGGAIASDSQGNIYVSGNLLFTNGFLLKLDNQGTLLWTKELSTSSALVKINDIAVSPQGAVYITGDFSSTATFGAITLTSKGRKDIFVAKLDAKGTFLWAKRAGSQVDHEYGYRIAVTQKGSIYVSGAFLGTAEFGSHTVTSNLGPRSEAAFLTKLNDKGEFLWAKMPTPFPFGLVVDNKENLYIVGNFKGQVKVGNIEVTSKGGNDILVAKLNDKGEHQWLKRAGSSLDFDDGINVAIDRPGNVYVVGSFTGDADFGADKRTSKGTDNTVNRRDAFVWKIPAQP